ncbi:MAG: enoyl-CoA hydratase-related protein [Jatrophihabitans sp.]|uniref:enoyl-CoA hydratase-related protein n=1 Tax=Jatrophihabitans sp. TaxID=1932789 RepID=UPI003F821498
MTLRTETDGGVAVLTIDRPERRNALDDRTMRGLADAFAGFRDDDAVQAVVLTGAGDKAFSSGVDLAAFAERPPTDADSDWYALRDFLGSVYPKPIVAAVNGVAVAAGLELLLACDVIVAAEHASFGIPEVKRGLIAAGGGTDLPRRLPLAVALEVGLTGERIDAGRAHQLGLVNHLRPSDDVLPEAIRVARLIAANAPLSLRLTKELMYASLDLDRAASLARAHEAGLRINASADAHEGAVAFVERRAPRWTGR